MHSCVSSNGNQNQKCFRSELCSMRKSNGNKNERQQKTIVAMAHWLLHSPLFDRRDESQQLWKTTLKERRPFYFTPFFIFNIILYPGNSRMENSWMCQRHIQSNICVKFFGNTKRLEIQSALFLDDNFLNVVNVVVLKRNILDQIIIKNYTFCMLLSKNVYTITLNKKYCL